MRAPRTPSSRRLPAVLPLLGTLAVATACRPAAAPVARVPVAAPAGGDPAGDTGTDDTGAAPDAAWAFLVYIVGDNDLEDWVMHDLDELEAGAPAGAAVAVYALADRAEGYATEDGDWTGTRLYRITADAAEGRVVSPVVEDWGEADMADPATLAAFLATGRRLAPSARTALVLWNHGTGWSLGPGAPPPPGIGWDDSSEAELSIARGRLVDGLDAHVAAAGPLDLIAFDACNMAFFEIGHALRAHARVMVAAQTTVGMEGLQYTPALAALGADPTLDGPALGRQLAADAVAQGGEWTFSAVDLGQMDAVAAALDDLAGAALAAPATEEAVAAAVARARGSEPGEAWRLWSLDLKDFARISAASADAEAARAGAALEVAVDGAVLGSHGAEGFRWVGGLNLNADPADLTLYHQGRGATWSAATRWDELLLRWYGG